MRKALIYSSAFHPGVGGVEYVSRTIAEILVEAGYRVTVATCTPSNGANEYPFAVLRDPSPLALLRAHLDADVALHMNVSLRALWPAMIARRPFIVLHNGFYRRDDGRLGWRDRLKYWVSRFSTNIACSEAVARDLPAGSVVIRNPYDDEVFRDPGPRKRTSDLIFVGRLVSEKGVDLLLRSLVELARDHGLRPRLTIVGSGPEERRLRTFCERERLLDRVSFCGTLSGHELGRLMAEHRIMVVPSRNEGLGVVALEGVASGCLVVGSDAGGLPEAIGECGLVFQSGDVEDLSRSLVRALTDEDLAAVAERKRNEHIARFSRPEVARRYLQVIDGALCGRKR